MATARSRDMEPEGRGGLQGWVDDEVELRGEVVQAPRRRLENGVEREAGGRTVDRARGRRRQARVRAVELGSRWR